MLLSLIALSFRSLPPVSLLCDEIVLLEDVIGRRLFKALLPRISVLLARMAGFPAVNIESPAGENSKVSKLNHVRTKLNKLWDKFHQF